MKHLSIYIVLLAILVIWGVCSCADDLKRISVFDAGAGDAVILFSVEESSLTRTESHTDMESCIDHAYLLFYDAGDNSDRAVLLAAVKAEVDESNSGLLKFKMPLRLTPDTDYRLVAVANADGYAPEGFNTFAEYIDSWCRDSSESNVTALHLYRSDRILAGSVNCIPMRGSISDDAPFRFSMQNGSYKVSASLLFRRLVARIDVANIVKDGFDVEGVALCNWRDAVSVALSESALGNRLGSVRGILSDEDEDTDDSIFLDMQSDDEDGIQQLKESVYCFPSVAYDSYPSDKESTALIIKARYQDDVDPSYYRVNIGLSGNVSEVKANTKYLVTIQSVKGRGAPSVGEAYGAEESPIVLSVVEDWDLEGNYAMDDKGNFIVLSSGNLIFDGDVLENKEVKVLTSKGLTWTAGYVPDSDYSSEAFRVVKLSDSSLAIGPSGENVGEDILSGKVRVSALTSDGGSLVVDIRVSQETVEERPYEPVIPTNKPFALIPVDGERVKIDNDAETIEIDGFDPDCFNSFIDIPFSVYINESEGNLSSINISTNLQWPLEGRVSLDHSSQYTYCKDSFAAYGSGQVLNESGGNVTYSTLFKSSVSAKKDDDIVYVSVGAMGPDDPMIGSENSSSARHITLSGNGKQVTYSLVIKPRETIIDDVILTDSNGVSWLIQDRNVQDISDGYSMKDYVGLSPQGKKWQAYNYSFNSTYTLTLPFKYKDQSGTALNETQHSLYQGVFISFSNRSTLSSHNNTDGIRINWLRKYIYSDEAKKVSPFYNEDNYSEWVFPNEDVFELCRTKLRVSKMRMFLVSDVSVKAGRYRVPVCCYMPYYTWLIGDTSNMTKGYYTSSNGNDPELINIIYFDNKEGKIYKTKSSQYQAYSRLVRPLTAMELEDYKTEYLGFGSQPYRLTICHPDTYESTPLGWLSY